MEPKSIPSPCCGVLLKPIHTIHKWGTELAGWGCPECKKYYTPEQVDVYRGIARKATP